MVATILLLLRNNCISFHQSSNFVWFLLNYSGSRTILFGIIAYTFSFVVTDIIDISLFVHSLLLFETLFVIFEDSSLFDNTSISFILYELVLSLHDLYHMCFVCFLVVTSSNQL